MILFVGLNDWIIRNMISSGFKEKIVESGIKTMGLVYRDSFDVYRDTLEDNLGMGCSVMDTKQWSDYGSELKKAGKLLDYASVAKLARVNNRTLRIQKRGNVINSPYRRAKLEMKFHLLKAFSFLGYEDRYIHTFEEALRDLEDYKTCSRFLKENNIKMLVSCSPETPYDTNWVVAANELGINTYAWIRSWDNITSKISYLPKTNGLFVWSTLMEEEFRRYYPKYANTEVYKTGAAQFDGHENKSNILEWEEFCRMTGLDPSKKFAAYTTGGPHICKDEHLVVEKIAAKIDSMDFESKPQILVRIHPYAWRTNLQSEFNNRNIHVWPPKDMMNTLKGGKTKGLLDDYRIMLSTFYHQAVNINIASTVTIDSCIFDKPVINIAFDPVPPEHFEMSIARYYEFDHYKPLVDTGGVRVVYDIEQFGKHFKEYYENPSFDREKRKKIVEIECGTVDGKAGERFVNKIIELYNIQD